MATAQVASGPLPVVEETAILEFQAARTREAYGRNYERLAVLKKKYDPENFFQLNHNIVPTGGRA